MSPQQRFAILDDDLGLSVEEALKSDVHLRVRMCGLKTALPGMPVFNEAANKLHAKWHAWLVAAWGTGDGEGQGDQMPRSKTWASKCNDLGKEAVEIIDSGTDEAESSSKQPAAKRAKVVASPSKVATPSPSKPAPVATTTVVASSAASPSRASRSKLSGSDQSLQIQLAAATAKLQFLDQEVRRLQQEAAGMATLRLELASMRANEELVKELRHQLDVRDQMIQQLLGSRAGAGKP